MDDECTKNQTRISFARVLFDIYMIQEMPNVIEITKSSGRKFSTKMLYDWKPKCVRSVLLASMNVKMMCHIEVIRINKHLGLLHTGMVIKGNHKLIETNATCWC